jgi:hypothetical protein
LAKELKSKKAILGVFDEGCMGMYNAIIDDYLLNQTGVFKERLSQSALFAGMQSVTDAEAGKVRVWLDKSGITFATGPNEETDLTDAQILSSARCILRRCGLRMSLGATRSGFSISRG